MRPILHALALLLVSSLAFADDASLRRCRQVAEPAQRLSCYDAITVAAPAEPPPARGADGFGLDRRAPKEDLVEIESSIVGDFKGWTPNEKVRLENGQVWQIADGSSGYIGSRTPKVKIRHGLLGAYFLEFEGINRSPRVRRVQ
jgi:hypothetical protein